MRFEPVELRAPDDSVREEADECDAFELAPATFAITICELAKSSNPTAYRDDLDLGDVADDLEVHATKILPERGQRGRGTDLTQRSEGRV